MSENGKILSWVTDFRLRAAILVSGIGLLIISLTQECYCTTINCGDSIAVFIVGFLGAFLGGAAISWFANPALIIAWSTIAGNRTLSIVFSGIAFCFAFSFLFFDKVLDDEAGNYREIVSYSSGYWLWLSSTILTFGLNLCRLIIPKMSKET